MTYLKIRSLAVWLLVAALPFFLTRPAQAQAKLTQAPGSELSKTYQAGKRYTLRLQYTDPKGDDLSKSKALFIDEAPSGRTSTAASVINGDVANGAIIEWDINGFEQGAHKGHFEITNDAGARLRYPKETTENYEFVVEAFATKLITMGIGLIICLALVPLITYLLARSINPRGDPSRTARVGLWVGILLACLLFIYLFVGMFGPLVYAILIIGLLALPVLLLNRR